MREFANAFSVPILSRRATQGSANPGLKVANASAFNLRHYRFVVCSGKFGWWHNPDVLAFDNILHRLYVSAESGVITIFDERDRGLTKVAQEFLAPNAHSVAVDSATHRVYFRCKI